MSSKYEFIDAQEYAYPVTKMCEWLEVSRSGFYEWRTRPESATAARRALLRQILTVLFTRTRQVYGYRRLHAELLRSGIHASPELVRRLMREAGLEPCQPRPYRITTLPDAAATPVPDLVGRRFTADRPGQVLVGDITYIHTWSGFAYLATVIDCCTKMVVGWAIDTHMKTDLIIRAIEMAAARITLAPNAIFHSDRGSQYTSSDFRTRLAELGIRPSVGRTGVCWDNAMAESFFGALKNELVYRTAFPTAGHARRAIVEYIEVFYNRQRLHSALGYRTPWEAHNDHLNKPIAA